MDLQRLECLARDFINDSLAPCTKCTYTVGQKRYLEFCKRFQLVPFPLAEDQLCTYVTHLMDEGLQHSTIKGCLSAIRRLQILKGLGDPFNTSWPLLEYTLRGIKLRKAKQKDTKPKERLPITPDILCKLRLLMGEGPSQPRFHHAMGSRLCLLLWFPQVGRSDSTIIERI